MWNIAEMAGKLAGNSGNAGKLRYESPRRGPPPRTGLQAIFFLICCFLQKACSFQKKYPDQISSILMCFFFTMFLMILLHTWQKFALPPALWGGWCVVFIFTRHNVQTTTCFFWNPPKTWKTIIIIISLKREILLKKSHCKKPKPHFESDWVILNNKTYNCKKKKSKSMQILFFFRFWGGDFFAKNDPEVRKNG